MIVRRKSNFDGVERCATTCRQLRLEVILYNMWLIVLSSFDAIRYTMNEPLASTAAAKSSMFWGDDQVLTMASTLPFVKSMYFRYGSMLKNIELVWHHSASARINCSCVLPGCISPSGRSTLCSPNWQRMALGVLDAEIGSTSTLSSLSSVAYSLRCSLSNQSGP